MQQTLNTVHVALGVACCALWEKLDCTEGSDETV